MTTNGRDPERAGAHKKSSSAEQKNSACQGASHRHREQYKFVKLADIFTLLTPDPSANIDILVRSTCEILDGTCSLYSRFDHDSKKLVTFSAYNAPSDIKGTYKADGHICYETTFRGEGEAVVIDNLDGSSYAKSDPNIKKYNLKSYLGHAVHAGDTPIGTLCIVDTRKRTFGEEEIQIIKALAKAVSLEEERLKAVSELKKSEESFRNIFSATTDAILIFDKETMKVVDLNDRICEMSGFSAEEILNFDYEVFSMVNEGFTAKMARYYIKKVLKEGPQTFQWHAHKKDGSSLWVQVDLKMAMIGGVERILGIIRDIDSHVKSDIALQESQRMLRLILDAIPVRVFWKDRKSRYIGCNLPFALDAGFSRPEDLIGKDDHACAWANEAQLYRSDDLLVLKSGKARMDYEEPMTTPDGKTVWRRTSKMPLKNAGGEIVGVLGTFENITESKQAEQALRESEEKYRNLIQHSSDAIYLLYDRKFELINDKFEEMFGLTLEEVNKPEFDFMQLVAPESHCIIEDRMRRFAEGEQIPPKYEFKALTKSGRRLEVETSVSQIKYKKGIATQGIIRDITARKSLEEQMRHTQKIEAVGRLAGGIAHDFNNLLTIINGYCELLLAKNLPGEVTNKIDQIYKAGINAGRLTSQLLAFSRKQVIQPKILNLNLIISDMIQMLHRLLGEDIEIETSLNPYLGTIKADPGQLEQIIINLAVNARDAMPSGGRLIIKSDMIELDETYTSEHLGSSSGTFILLSIRDTGTGMDPEVRSHIFEPFFTTKERGKGTGLGLSTVYGIVKQNEGYITVETEPGAGANFKIYLPQVIADQQQPKREPSPYTSLEGKETILIAEDDPGVRDLTQSILSDYGYHVLEAEDGQRALQIIEENKGKIQLLLTDVIMPRMGGKELADNVSARYPDLKIIYCSGYTEDNIVQHGVLDSGTEFIHKPFSQQDLAEKIRKVLDNRVPA